MLKIVDWPRSTNGKQEKQFVATGYYYRRFVKDFAYKARPFIDLTKKDTPFLWSQECEEAQMGHWRSGVPWDTLALDYMGLFPHRSGETGMS